MPACGTVTISPACRVMLFLVSPVSIRLLRLMVIVLVSGGGSVDAGELAEAAAVPDEEESGGALFGVPEVLEVWAGAGKDCTALFGGGSSVGAVVGSDCSGPIAGGSVVSGWAS